MTKPLPWPRHARNARLDTIALAQCIDEHGDDAKRALRQGNADLAMVTIVEMQRKAHMIEVAMRKVEAPPPEES